MSAKLFKDLTASSAHVDSALGDGKRRKPVVFDEEHPIEKRSLQPHDADTAKSPFLYDPNALGSLRPDQVPRFFGALTDSNKLPEAEVDLGDLHAMQDRVDPKKVAAIGELSEQPKKLPVVVQHNGKQYIADGHHRLAAQWLAGETKAKVRLKDLEPVSSALKRLDPAAQSFRIAKVDEQLGLVFGWAIVCKVDGEDYYDLNIDHSGQHAGKRVPEHIPEAVMTKAAVDFMQSARAGNEMHDGPDVGKYVFAFPMTSDIAKALGITTQKTGLLVAYSAPPAVLAKFKDGTYTGFSIEGSRLDWTEH